MLVRGDRGEEKQVASERNRAAYRSASLVNYYRQLQQLQPAEQVVLERWRNRLPGWRLLDLGVGGGRTTAHFAPLAGEYVGADYAPEMVAACRDRFPETPTRRFAVADARDLRQFADDSFDAVLFSFNGIDYVEHGDRLQILREICRVGKPGSPVCFSSHNLQGIARAFDYRQQVRLNPLATYTNLVVTALLRAFNPAVPRQLATADYCIVRDEPHNFRLANYYIRPDRQLAQLQPDFERIEVYAWQTGRQLAPEELRANTDMWLYYLCAIASGT